MISYNRGVWEEVDADTFFAKDASMPELENLGWIGAYEFYAASKDHSFPMTFTLQALHEAWSEEMNDVSVVIPDIVSFLMFIREYKPVLDYAIRQTAMDEVVEVNHRRNRSFSTLGVLNAFAGEDKSK